MIREFLSTQKGKYLKNLRSKYSEDLRSVLPKNPSIISNNCLGGFISQDLDLPYLSPIAGLYFFFPDYIEFLSDLEANITSDITFVKESKYLLGNQRIAQAKHTYPVGLLNGKFEIHFLHYKNAKEAEIKWSRRLDRFDINNLVVLGTELDLCTKKDIKAFDELPFERKVFLTREVHELKSVKFVKEFAANPKIGDPYRYGHLLYRNLIEKLTEQ